MDHDVPAGFSLLSEKFTNPASGIIRNGNEKLRPDNFTDIQTKPPEEIEVVLDLVPLCGFPVGKNSPVEKK
jgi:hypothetical protein